MSQQIEGPVKTFIAAAPLAPGLRVKITDATTSPPTVNVAGATDVAIGVVNARALAASDPVGIRLRTAEGTYRMVASGAITCGNAVYAAASGKVASTGTVYEGVALETTTTNGDILEVCPMPNVDITATIVSTNGIAFEVDADSATPKIALASQTGGTGDFTTTLKPETTLSADTYVILPETTDGDVLMACTLAQTVPGIKTFTGGIVMSGAVDLQFSGTTGQPEIVVPDNVADALSIKDGTGGADLLTLTTTNGAEAVNIATHLRPYTVATPVAAAGTDHTNAGALSRATVQHITSDGATKGVILPTGVAGDMIVVINDSGTAAEIYAAVGGTINGAGANASMVVPASKGVWAFCVSADTWVMFDMTARASAS